MQSKAQTINEYVSEIPQDRIEAFQKLRDTISQNLDPEFVECMSYGMIGYVVPHEIYPAGYHCDPKLPLPMMNLASQKNFIALYHMGIYANENLMEWFKTEYSKVCKTKLDMGKSCIRFKKMNDIPFDLIGELCKKMTVNQWIDCYEKMLNSSKK
jgi:uncharacterized protein YdhG (YjbR/CyaY superfamily)